jgi:hypothetical protein
MSDSPRDDHGHTCSGFPGPDNQVSYTCSHVLEEGHPILRVSHDEDDGAWQFLCGGLHEDAAQCRIVCLGCMVRREPTLVELAGLPAGWGADRQAVGAAWERTANEPTVDE